MSEPVPLLLIYAALLLSLFGALRWAASWQRRNTDGTGPLTAQMWCSVADVGLWLGVVVALLGSGWLGLHAVMLIASVGLVGQAARWTTRGG